MSDRPKFDPTRALCKIKKSDLPDLLDEIAPFVTQPTLVCRKCARVADRKKLLCKPVKLPDR